MHCNCNGRDLEPPLVVESQLLPSCNLAKISLRSDAVWKTIQHILERGRKLSRPLTLVFARVTTQPSSVLSLNELLQVSINRDVLSSISCLSKTLNVYRLRGDLKDGTLLFYILCCLGGVKLIHTGPKVIWLGSQSMDVGFVQFAAVPTLCRSEMRGRWWGGNSG